MNPNPKLGSFGEAPKPPTPVDQHDLMEMASDQVKKGVETDFGIEITDIKEINVGFKNKFYRATTATEKKIFIGINKDKAVIEAEMFGYELLKQKGIPVPEVMAYQENPPTVGHPTMILSAVRGVSLEEADLPPEQENAIYEKLGEILRKINEIKVEGFGPLRKVDGIFKGEYETYEKYCKWRKERFDEAVNFLVKN